MNDLIQSDNEVKKRKRRKSSECDWTCKYCNEKFDKLSELKLHKRTCEFNKYRRKPNRWKCDECSIVFNTRGELYNHIRSCHRIDEHRKDYGVKRPVSERECPFCHEKLIMSNYAFSSHVNHCYCNPNRKEYPKGHKMSEETRKKLSDYMKKAHEEGKIADWNRFKKSYPEEWFMDVIKNEFNDKDYKYNFQVGRYRLDFAWPKKMRYIEIDGDQHYRTKEAIEHDRVRTEYLEKLGWTLLRLSWSYIRSHNIECAKSMKAFIDDVSDLPLELQYNDKRKEYYEQRRKLKEEHPDKLDSMGRYISARKSKDELLELKDKIYGTGIDITKFGWKMKVARKLNISKSVINNVIRRLPEEFKNMYKDKHTI